MPLKLKDLDSKLVEAFKELMEFILLIDLRKPLKDLEKKVDNNYNKNIKYTDDEIAKLKLHLEGLIEQIQIDNSVDLTDAIEALRKELNLKIEQQNQYIDQRFEQMLKNIETTIDNFKTEVNNQINVLGERVDTFDSRISNNSTNITNLTEVTLSLIYELIKSKKSTADKMQSLLTDKSSVATDKTKSEASILAVVTFLGETPQEGERYSFSPETLSEIYPLLLSALKDTTIYLNKCIEALRADIISIANKYTDLKVEELKEYIEERLKDVKPSVDLCEEIGKLPQQPTWGEEPRFLVHTKDGCITVPVSPEGIFTDIRMNTSFTGNVTEGGSNSFQAFVRNVSSVPVGEIQLVVTLPKAFEGEGSITVGEEVYSQPKGGSITKVKTEDNIRTYKISKLDGGDQSGLSIPLTWNTKGTFQASAQLTILDSNVIDNDHRDDYSVSTCVVNAKTEGEETVDCPLIECKLNGTIQVPIISANTGRGDSKPQLELNRVVKLNKGDYLEFNHPITYSNLARQNTSYRYGTLMGGKLYGAAEGYYYDVPERIITVDLVNIEGNKYKVEMRGDYISSVIQPIGVRVGVNCNPQILWVIPSNLDAMSEVYVGKIKEDKVSKFDVLKGTATYTTVKEESESSTVHQVISNKGFEDLKIYPRSTTDLPYKVTSSEIITLNIKKDSEVNITMEGDRMNFFELAGNLGVKIEGRVVNVKTSPLATSRDSTKTGDLIVNIIE